MLRSAKSLRDYHIRATDGNVGRVHDFLFDGEQWVIRYAVVNTSEWLPGRKVLLIPDALGPPSTEGEILPVALTHEQLENSPNTDTDRPISRQHEMDLFEYYGWSPYWGAGGGEFAEYGATTEAKVQTATPTQTDLRSMRQVAGHSIHASDGHIGHVEDFILDDEEWVVRYIVVDTRNWLPGRKVLISPEWVSRIDWPGEEVWLDHSKEEIRKSPHYDPNQPVNRQYELRLYDYYGRRKYWV
jgi:sporulation protein YlmC with PRC-barrel domain